MLRAQARAKFLATPPLLKFKVRTWLFVGNYNVQRKRVDKRAQQSLLEPTQGGY